MISAPPIKVRLDSVSWAMSTEDTLANTTSDSITTEVTPDGRRDAPNCKAQLPSINSTARTTAMTAQLASKAGKPGTTPRLLATTALTRPMLMQPANMTSMRAWPGIC